MRMATLSSCATDATEPSRMLLDKPVGVAPSLGTPHSGAMRGNSMNISTISGAPKKAVRADSQPTCLRLGRPTGMLANTSEVSSPHTDTNIATPTAIDCEYKKWVRIKKKPRKNTTKASRRARASSIFKAVSATVMVTPGSLPSTVPKLQ